MSDGKKTKARFPRPLVLIIDDDPADSENARVLLTQHFDIEIERDFAAGLQRVRDLAPSVVLLDIYEEDEPKGLTLLPRIATAECAPPVIMVTREKSPEIIVECMRRGAYDYLTKRPFDRQRSLQVIHQALEREALRSRIATLESERLESTGRLVWSSAAMDRVMDRIAKVAPTETAVLITGESGTGKDLIAEEIHRRSRRAPGRFLKINCAAFPPTLLESELFGHEKGAFTDAKSRRRGVFEMAAGGTLFLNEVGDCTTELQVRLLQVIEDRSFRRVGGEEDIQADVRILAATHHNLEERVKAGDFREDLYYRFDQFRIYIPPLRDRHDDILTIAEHYIARLAREHNKPVKGLTPAARQALVRREWRGNVRALRHVIENAVIYSDGEEIDIGDVTEDPLAIGREIPAYREAREEFFTRFKAEYFAACLRACEGNVAQVARLSGRPAQAIWNTLKEIDLDPASFKPPAVAENATRLARRGRRTAAADRASGPSA